MVISFLARWSGSKRTLPLASPPLLLAGETPAAFGSLCVNPGAEWPLPFCVDRALEAAKLTLVHSTKPSLRRQMASQALLVLNDWTLRKVLKESYSCSCLGADSISHPLPTTLSLSLAQLLSLTTFAYNIDSLMACH